MLIDDSDHVETAWMVCPYAVGVCGADATFVPQEIDDDYVKGLLVCANGHRWVLTKIGDPGEWGR